MFFLSHSKGGKNEEENKTLNIYSKSHWCDALIVVGWLYKF